MFSLQSAKRILKYGIIRAGLEVSALSVVRALLPSASGRGLIFTLHHVRPDSPQAFAPNAILSVTPEFLEKAIKAVLEMGMTPVHLHDLPARLADQGDNRTFVAFTLDDGYRNNAQYAAPVFRKFGIPYTIFVAPGLTERSRSMWWETAEALVRNREKFDFDFGQGTETVTAESLTQKHDAFDRLAAFVHANDEDVAVAHIDGAARQYDIDPLAIVDNLVMTKAELQQLVHDDPLAHMGAHTMTHVNLKRVDLTRLENEVRQSISTLQTYTGVSPRSFSYPYGYRSATGQREAETVLATGIPVAVTTQPGVLSRSSLDNIGLLPRVSLNGLFQKKRYVKALASGIPFKLTK
jgi:peptidoglycan/xylan/chitin deacetylase (PgdA/CDA1 family)